MLITYNMPPRGRKKKQLNEWWLGDTPEVRAVGAGLRALRQHNAGYLESQDEGNIITSRSLAAKPGERNAKTEFMTGVPGRLGGKYLVGTTGPELMTKLGLPNRSVMNREFTAGAVPEDSRMPGFQRSFIKGVPVMRSYHYPAQLNDYDEQTLFDLVGHRALD